MYITDIWDPSIGVLLSPDLDFHFNHFELSFCPMVVLESQAYSNM